MFRRSGKSKDISTTVSILLAAVTGVICVSGNKSEAVASSTTVTVALIGDVNNDEVVDGRDASEVLTYYAKVSAGNQDAKVSDHGDVNNDGIVDAVDASTILTAYSCEAVGKEFTWPIANKSNFVSNIEEHLEKGYVWAVKAEPDNSSKTVYVLNEDDGFNCVMKRSEYDEHFYKIVFNEGKSVGYMYFESYDEYCDVVVEEDYSLMPSWGWIG